MKFARSIRGTGCIAHHTDHLDVYDMEVETVDKNGEKLLSSQEEYKTAKIALDKVEEEFDRAGDAYDKAEEAYAKAEEACDNAKEAYEEAEEACEEAEEAYAKAKLLEDNASLSLHKVLPKDLENYFLIDDRNRRRFIKKSEFFEKYEFKGKK